MLSRLYHVRNSARQQCRCGSILVQRSLASRSATATSTSRLQDIAIGASCNSSDKSSYMHNSSAVIGALAAAASYLSLSNNNNNDSTKNKVLAEQASSTTHPSPTPSDKNGVFELDNTSDSAAEEIDIDTVPIYTSADVAKNNGKNGSSIWMSYGGIIYDVTHFIHNHPGGSERILLAAGSAVEPYWHLYRQHFATDLPMQLMERMIVGRLAEEDQDAIDAQMEQMAEENEDPYVHEPTRSDVLIVHGDQPMNAEVPADVLTSSYITPSDVFYIRHHHPVPFLTSNDSANFSLDIDINVGGDAKDAKNKKTFKVTMEDLKKLPKVEVVATLQCSGNRRGDMNSVKRTSGTAWSQGAISTSKWGGARLTDVLKLAGVEDPVALTEQDGIQKHVRFESLDGMRASIHMEKATNPYGDVIVAYEMNDEPLTRDHGYPLRVVVPGYAAVRNVKWLKRIEIATSEAEGAWQQGLNYKTLPPSVTDAKSINLEKMPSMTEVAVFSGITHIDTEENNLSKTKSKSKSKPGKTVMVKAKGWAWSGGGRNIVRVDLTGDGGSSWATANIVEGEDQKFGRAWAWVFWECEVPAVVKKDGTVQLSSKAVDLAFNSQPESVAHAWNVRGLGNNSWHTTARRV